MSNRAGPLKSLVSKVLASKFALYMLSLVVFILLWDLAAARSGVLMPRPLEVLAELGRVAREPVAGKILWLHLWFSLKRVLVGFGIAVAIGVPLGLLMGFNAYIRAVINPIFELLKPMPPIAWISLAILWFGIGETSKIFIVVLGSVVPIIINSYRGVQFVDPTLVEAVRTLGASRNQELREVVMPAAFPAIFAGLQTGLSYGMTTVVAAELVGAREGLGFLTILGMNISEPALIVGGMLVIALLAWLIAIALNIVERWVCPWRTELE